MTVAALVAGWQYSQAGGAYQVAVREEIKRQTAELEDIRQVYGAEAPQAFQVASAQAEADLLRPLRYDGRLAASEYTLASQTAFGLRRSTGMKDALFEAGRGYDVPRRLAEVQAESPDLYGLDPAGRLREGDRWAAWALGSLAVAAAAVLAAVAAASVLRPRRWRRPPTGSGRRVFRDLEFIPQPATATAEKRPAVRLHLLVTTLLLLLPLGQLYAAGAEQRAQAEASRRATQIGTAISASNQRNAFLVSSKQTAVRSVVRGFARELAAIDAEDPEVAGQERRVASVEQAVAGTMVDMAGYMARPPARTDGVDSATVTALRSTPKDWPGLGADQSHQVDLAQRSGNRALLLAAATAFAVVAELLAASALEVRRRGWLLWPVGVAAVSLGLTAATLF